MQMPLIPLISGLLAVFVFIPAAHAVQKVIISDPFELIRQKQDMRTTKLHSGPRATLYSHLANTWYRYGCWSWGQNIVPKWAADNARVQYPLEYGSKKDSGNFVSKLLRAKHQKGFICNIGKQMMSKQAYNRFGEGSLRHDGPCGYLTLYWLCLWCEVGQIQEKTTSRPWLNQD